MLRIAEFEKVSRERFVEDYNRLYSYNEYYKDPARIYDSIRLPERATSGSAGYDFFLPEKEPISLGTNESCIIPTGIRVKIEEGWMLAIFPRSGLGFKYEMQLANTVGIIDSDYYYADNEGHIMIKVVNRSQTERLAVHDKTAFAQGIFIPYGITLSDKVNGVRTGGFGSTDKGVKR